MSRKKPKARITKFRSAETIVAFGVVTTDLACRLDWMGDSAWGEVFWLDRRFGA